MPICTLCELHETACSVNVGGVGRGSILVVGAYLGGEENLAGEAFVGPSGKELRQLLADAGFGPNDYRLTNALRCMVPGRDTQVKTEWIDACRTHLKAEILEHKPEAIIALGDVALKALCKKSGIKEKRGQPIPLHKTFEYECEVWPTYHNAFLFKKPVLRPTVLADFRKVRNRHMPDEEIKWEWWDGKTKLCPPLAYDIETWDENHNVTDRVTHIAVTDGVRTFCEVEPGKIKKLVERMLLREGVRGFNSLAFDDIVMRKNGMNVKSARDVMYMAYLEDENQPLGLEALAVKYIPGTKGWKDAKDAPLGSDKFAEYNARDSIKTLQLHDILLQRLGDSRAGVPRVRIADEILLPAKLALDACTERGIFIDAGDVAAARVELETQREDHRRRLHEIAGGDFNPNSNAEVAVILQASGLQLKATPSGEPSTAEASLAPHKGHPFVDALEAYRESAKAMSSFVTPYERATKSEDGRVHPTYSIIRTVVGRTSAKGPNVQQLDRDFKSFFSAPKGCVFTQADYSALHFRLIAFCAREQNILAKYRENPTWDPHGAFAERLYGPGYTKDQRQIAKGQFAIMYIGEWPTLQEYLRKRGTIISDAEAYRMVEEWHAAYPRLRSWYGEVAEELKAYGYVETAVGRRRHFGNVEHAKLGRKRYTEVLREAVNFKVLGLEPDIALPGLFFSHQVGLPVNYFCHDAVGYEFSSLYAAEKTEPVIRECMIHKPVEFLRERFNVILDAPLALEITHREAK